MAQQQQQQQDGAVDNDTMELTADLQNFITTLTQAVSASITTAMSAATSSTATGTTPNVRLPLFYGHPDEYVSSWVF